MQISIKTGNHIANTLQNSPKELLSLFLLRPLNACTVQESYIRIPYLLLPEYFC